MTADDILRACGLLGAVDISMPEQRELAAWLAGMKQLAEEIEALGLKGVEGHRRGGKTRAAAQTAGRINRRRLVRHFLCGDPHGPEGHTVIAKTLAAKPLGKRTRAAIAERLAGVGMRVSDRTLEDDIKAVVQNFGKSAS